MGSWLQGNKLCESRALHRVQFYLEARNRYMPCAGPFLAVLLICSYMQLRLDTP
jgi:hypothetical protein